MSGKEPSPDSRAPGGPLPSTKTVGHELDHEIWFLRGERPDLSERRLRSLYRRAELALLFDASPEPGHVRKAGEVLVTDEGTTLFMPNERGGPEIRDVLAWINRTAPKIEHRGRPSGWGGEGTLEDAFARAYRKVAPERPGRRPTWEKMIEEVGGGYFLTKYGLRRALDTAGLSFDDLCDELAKEPAE